MSTILVVDDSKTMRSLIKSVISEETNFTNIIEAEDGEDGLNKFNSNNIDFICTDFNMPKMNGGEMVTKIRQNPKAAKLPILVITTDEKSKDVAKSSGASGWLKKPFKPEVLAGAIKKLVVKYS